MTSTMVGLNISRGLQAPTLDLILQYPAIILIVETIFMTITVIPQALTGELISSITTGLLPYGALHSARNIKTSSFLIIQADF